MSNRECGECTACCFTHPVADLEKPAGQLCQHCEVGRRCGIYTQRPPNCRDYQCQWLMGVGSEECRPDRTGVVLDFVRRQTESSLNQVFDKLATMWEAREKALETAEFLEATMVALKDGIHVIHVYLSGRIVLFLPRGEKLPADDSKILKQDGYEIKPFPSI